MGLFLAMSSVVGRDEEEVVRCLASYTAERSGAFEAATDDISEDEGARISRGPAGPTVTYPYGFTEWDEVSAKLSADLATSVFSFHIHDGDLWMFVAFRDGDEVLKFNPLPDYWIKLAPDERRTWIPTAAQVAALVPGSTPERLVPYLREWPDEGIYGKANPEDEFGFTDWQVVDFMRELGFHYPDIGEGNLYRMKVT